jgi:outer membrane cobalamin receptor
VDVAGARVNLTAIAVGSRIDRDFATSFSGQRVRLPGYVRVDLAVGYRLWADPEAGRAFELRLLIQNLLDKDYQEIFSKPAPGLNVLAGAEVTFR